MVFNYPDQPHRRKHGPSGYEDYTSYKDWLRDEFAFRCVYCLRRERWFPNGQDAFGVEHVRPKGVAAYQQLERDYENLVYACNACNSRKQRQLLLDPCATAFGQHLRVDETGKIQGITTEGKYLVDILALDRPEQEEVRVRYLRLLSLHQRYPQDPEVTALYMAAFGYPDDLPNLEMLRPKGNSRPEGLRDCFWRRREEGRLTEEIYF
jgi:hypothetical protein